MRFTADSLLGFITHVSKRLSYSGRKLETEYAIFGLAYEQNNARSNFHILASILETERFNYTPRAAQGQGGSLAY
jgi:hypothetical protein